MNPLRFAGDMLHLLSVLLLMFKLMRSKNCVGVSCRMQEMYMMVFIFRYLDILWKFVSLYNSTMKITYITCTCYLVYMMRYKTPICQTYERSNDDFQYEVYLLGPCFALGLILTDAYTIPDILWSTSIWLESVAIIPQLVLMQKRQDVENLTSDFVGCMGAYRGFYILNWIYRYFADDYVNWIGWIGGLVQTGLYCDFFYYYAKSKWYGNKLVLPGGV